MRRKIDNTLILAHNLRALLRDLDDCEIEVERDGVQVWESASSVRSVTIGLDFVDVPIGTIIDAEDHGASCYPGQIRYGDTVTDFAPSFVTAMAQRLTEWATKNFRSIRCSPK